MIGCFVSQRIQAALMLRTGTKHRARFVNLSGVGRRLWREVCEALPAMHAFTGCDSTSAFAGGGKQVAYKLITAEDPRMRNVMCTLGTDFDVTPEKQLSLEAFVCAMYSKASFQSVNELKYHLFCTRTTQSSQLPPTKDALSKHVLRVNYQAAIWKSALEDQFNIPSPRGNGWFVDADNNQISIDWMSQEPDPKGLMKMVSCKCTKSCTSRYSCRHAGLVCPDICGCINCENT